jgi:hypothetical protein
LGDVIDAGEFGSVFRTWWLGDFSGALVFAPLVLVWAGRRSWRMPRAQLAEGAAVLASLIVLIEVPSQADVPYAVFPILIWAALRFGPTGAATAVAITSCLTVWNTAHGSGPFVRASITHSVLATQLFVTVAALTSLILAAVTAERTASEHAQQALTDEQTALRRIATLVAGEAASDRVFEQVTVEAAQTLGASAASLARFDEDGTVTFVGGWSDTGRLAFPVGSRVPVEETGVLAEIRKTGRPERIDDYKGRAPEIVERLSDRIIGRVALEPMSAALPYLFPLCAVAVIATGPRKLLTAIVAAFAVYYAAILFLVLPEQKHTAPLLLPLCVVCGVGIQQLAHLAAKAVGRRTDRALSGATLRYTAATA